jgi:glutathione peroxidase
LSQEPGSPADIKAFVAGYGVEFRMMAKVNVNGPEICDVYKVLKTSSDKEQIDWNFAKYLVSRNAESVKHFKSGVNPVDLKGDIEKMLAE